jgi:carboxymethylenebutenolidase
MSKHLTTDDFDPRVLGLFDRYVHGLIDRREFLRATATIVGATAATGVLAALAPDFAAAQQVSASDARLHLSRVDYEAPKGHKLGRGYLAKPAKLAKPAGVVLVAHENRGLNPHIEDIARRLALAGYIAFAPDALFPVGGYPGDEDKAREAFGKLDQELVKEDFLAAASFANALPGGNGKLGTVGFCWGGGMVNFLATRVPAIAAAAPFYGVAPPLEDVPAIKAELLVVLAASDDRVNATWPAYRQALDSAKVVYSLLQPEGTVHGFNNDTTPRYNAPAAGAAWARTLSLFERKLA